MQAQLTNEIRGEAALNAWIAAGGLARVDRLILWDGALGDDAAGAIAGAGAETLGEVDLSWNHIGARGAAELARALVRLERLRLYHNDLGTPGAAAIAELAPPVHALNLCGNAIGDAGVAHVARGGLRTVRELALGCNDISDAGAAALAAGAWPELAMLNIRANQLTADGACALLALPALRRFGLDENALGTAGLVAIAARPGFARLEWLNLGGCGLDDACVDTLAASCSPNLRELRVHDNELSEVALRALRDALPDCLVVGDAR